MQSWEGIVDLWASGAEKDMSYPGKKDNTINILRFVSKFGDISVVSGLMSLVHKPFSVLKIQALIVQDNTWVCALLSCSVVSDSVTPWTAAHQAPLSMGILKKNQKTEGYFSSSKNTGVCCHALLQGIFLTQGSPAFQVDSLPSEPLGNPKNSGEGSLSLVQVIFPTQELNQGLLHYRKILYKLSYQGNPYLSTDHQ